MNAVFISGTDTGCGKTAVGCALASAARALGLTVRVLKPVETGCREEDGRRVAQDAEALAHAAGDGAPADTLCPYRLRLPASPLVAARAEGLSIDASTLDKAFAEASAGADLLLVEGAGGLRVKLTHELDMAGLAARLELPLLIVARATLGTYNHTQLTLEAAAARGLRTLGVVVSHTTPELSAADRHNLDGLLEDLPVPLLGELPHGARELVPAVDIRALLRTIARA